MMFGDLLSSRWIQGGLVFFVLSVSGSFLFSWHVRHTTEKAFARDDRFLQGLPIQNETRTAAGTIDTSGVDFSETQTLRFTDALQMADATETVSPIDDTAEFMDVADAFLPDDFVLEEEPPEDVPVSPYGFGPYPEVPMDYPFNISWEWDEEHLARLKKAVETGLQKRSVSWTEFLKENELMSRVALKLWKESRYSGGITSSDQTDLFYPNEPDVLYVKWGEATLPNGEVRRYMARTIGSALSNVSIAAQEGREPPPDWLEIRSMDEGIDPYNFLGLNR